MQLIPFSPAPYVMLLVLVSSLPFRLSRSNSPDLRVDPFSVMVYLHYFFDVLRFGIRHSRAVCDGVRNDFEPWRDYRASFLVEIFFNRQIIISSGEMAIIGTVNAFPRISGVCVRQADGDDEEIISGNRRRHV